MSATCSPSWGGQSTAGPSAWVSAAQSVVSRTAAAAGGRTSGPAAGRAVSCAGVVTVVIVPTLADTWEVPCRWHSYCDLSTV